AWTLPEPPPLGPTILGSFALLYSQLLLPTPSGAGAVELGFLGGAAGDFGEHQGWLLLAWRFYTNGIGVALGIWLAVQIYGWPALRKLVRSGPPGTPCGSSACAHTTVPAPTSRVSSPTIMLAFPWRTR